MSYLTSTLHLSQKLFLTPTIMEDYIPQYSDDICFAQSMPFGNEAEDPERCPLCNGFLSRDESPGISGSDARET